MPLPPVDKIHLTFDPMDSTVPLALAEVRNQLAGICGFTVTVVEFEDGSVVDVDALPTFDDPLDMRLYRTRNGDWGWQFFNQHGRTGVETTTVHSMLNDLLNFIALNGGPDLALHERHTGDDA